MLYWLSNPYRNSKTILENVKDKGEIFQGEGENTFLGAHGGVLPFKGAGAGLLAVPNMDRWLVAMMAYMSESCDLPKKEILIAYASNTF